MGLCLNEINIPKTTLIKQHPIYLVPTILLPGVGAVHVAEGVAVDPVPGDYLALGKGSLKWVAVLKFGQRIGKQFNKDNHDTKVCILMKL